MKKALYNFNNDTPLTLEEIQQINQLELSTIEKHHVRLLAHCLSSFKQISRDNSSQSLPSREEQLDWCFAHPKLSKDKEFIFILINQFSAASSYLEKIASNLKIPPLELTLEDLISYAIGAKS
tara:strand:- start:29 stop:397 length:369 start_codon:yes stop_codon:yes gene_type:complete